MGITWINGDKPIETNQVTKRQTVSFAVDNSEAGKIVMIVNDGEKSVAIKADFASWIEIELRARANLRAAGNEDA